MSEALAVTPLLDSIRANAEQADQQRTLADEVINGFKANPIMGFTASRNIGGGAATVERCADELAAVAACCTSSAWVLWNHLCTFHLFAGLLGPSNAEMLGRVVNAGEWVCFPAGASTGVRGVLDGDDWVLNGKAAFGSGARYAEYAGVSFVTDAEQGPLFALADLRQAGVKIDADWDAMSLRASATDTVYYENARVPAVNVVPFHYMYREVFRRPDYAVVDPRYREDWVALSDLWLGAMAVGLVQANLDDVLAGIRDRIAIAGVKVAQRPTVHVNLGLAQAKLNAARDTVRQACLETDQRIANEQTPDEADYLRQMAASMAALQLCDEALRLQVRVMGGNGLREGPAFERRYRDFQAMPLHINAHQDRVSEQFGRHLLGLAPENPF
ncbi:MAG: acyl-CoA dehydrogenase family protein [Pseudomonadota bacterium]